MAWSHSSGSTSIRLPPCFWQQQHTASLRLQANQTRTQSPGTRPVILCLVELETKVGCSVLLPLVNSKGTTENSIKFRMDILRVCSDTLTNALVFSWKGNSYQFLHVSFKFRSGFVSQFGVLPTDTRSHPQKHESFRSVKLNYRPSNLQHSNGCWAFIHKQMELAQTSEFCAVISCYIPLKNGPSFPTAKFPTKNFERRLFILGNILSRDLTRPTGKVVTFTVLVPWFKHAGGLSKKFIF